MKGKRIVLCILLAVILLLSVPFKVISKDLEMLKEQDVYTRYEAVLWQYSYECVSRHNDRSVTMNKKVTLLGSLTVYEKEELMMVGSSGELVPWSKPEMVTYI